MVKVLINLVKVPGNLDKLLTNLVKNIYIGGNGITNQLEYLPEQTVLIPVRQMLEAGCIELQ